MKNSYSLPNISITYLVQEFLSSKLSLERVAMSHSFLCIYLCPICIPSHFLYFKLISLHPFSDSLMIITLANNSTHLSHFFHIPLTCTHPFTFCFIFLHTLFGKKNSFISSIYVNPFEVLMHIYRKSSSQRKKRERRGKRKEKKKEKKE